MPVDRKIYPRPKSNQSKRPKHVAGLIAQLRDIERKTDPKYGARSARGKDLAARNALKIANDLVQAVAGWALDHVAGLVLKDLKSVPLTMANPPEHLDDSKVGSTNDDHRHEWYGRSWVGRLGTGFDIDPNVGRNWLISLVRANPGIFNLELMLLVTSALKASEYGEIHPMLKPTKERRKINWTILQLHREAVVHVKTLQARGIKKVKALELVAGALNVSIDTVRTWEQRLRPELGAFASKGSNNDSDPAYLQELARQYKAAVASKRTKRVIAYEGSPHRF